MFRYLSRRSLFALGAAALVLSALAMALMLRSASAAPADTVADRVFGQGGSFTSTTCNLGNGVSGPASASSLCVSVGAAVDAAGNVYVADFINHRVLEYNTPLTTDTVADRVFGQGGSFTTNGCNLGNGTGGPASASSLCQPSGVALDGAGRLYISDYDNSRVLEYDSPLTSSVADRVFGQGGSFTTNTCNGVNGFFGPASASSLCTPGGVAVDATGRLYVADTTNQRVLEYDSPLTNPVPNRVFGQGGSFTSGGGACNLGGISASSLCNPWGVALDATGRLYVGDGGNSRVLEYDSPLTSPAASRMFGQGGSFTSGDCNLGNGVGGPASASSLCVPFGVAVDTAGNLYVTDSYNSRVLEYDTPLTTDAVADRVFGQGGGFTSNTCNLGGISASSLCNPVGVAVDAAGNLYVAEYDNDSFDTRVLEFDSPLGTPPTLLPTANPNAVGGLVDLTTTGGGDGGSGTTALLAGLLLAFAAMGAATVGFRRASIR